ncbi:MAG: cytochrome c biogenesis protein CcsA [Desulfovibrio sp.]|nr:cytochrome c biogenesis protein CcsA [Desulfovibrio sp.]
MRPDSPSHRRGRLARNLFPPLSWGALAGGLSLAACQWLIFAHTPLEASMGITQKIFYLHLPLACWGLCSFFLVFAAGIAYLKTRRAVWDTLALAAAEVGLLLTVLALASGMIWARTAWGVWWTWDARLTTTLVMCFVYAGYLLIRTLDMAPERRSLVCAAVGIAAFLDVPLVFFSARLWSYIHPASISLAPEMKVTVIASGASLALLWACLLLFRWRLAEDERRLEMVARKRLLRRA